MKRQIWKYEVLVNDGAKTIAMPSHASIVHVGSQNPPFGVTFWAEVDPKADSIDRKFLIVGTGHDLDDNWAYLGTVDTGMALVWHLYEIL